MSTFSRRLTAAISGLTLAGTGLLAAAPSNAGVVTVTKPAGATASRGVVAPVPTLNWVRCEGIPRALCTTADVPLDYGDPTGPKLTLDLVKAPKLGDEPRLGTVFVNPGGPGGSAREFAPWAADLLGDTVAMKYDVIGIDPRGVGPGSSMSCLTEDPGRYYYRPFPETVRQSRKLWRTAMVVRDACRNQPNEVVSHMTTADTARDMDLIRQAVGEPLLNYYGISYGSYLGATYAAMFPDQVGRFVVDGVLNPVEWATGTNPTLPFSTRLRSGQGAREALRSALAECNRLGRKTCVLAPNADVKWRKLVRRAKNGNLTMYGGKARFSDLIGDTLGQLYSTYGYDGLAYTLADIYKSNFKPGGRQSPRIAEAGLTLAKVRARTREIMRAPYTPIEAFESIDVGAGNAFLGVACSDTDNPVGRPAWWEAGRTYAAGGFGSLWTWASAPCSAWLPSSKADRFAGPWSVTTHTPVLVVGNAHDPATPIWGAQKVQSLFAGSRLLTLDGWGHGALGNSCATAAYDAYFATGALPAEGAVCQPDVPLFGGDAWRLRPRWTHTDRWRSAG